MIPRKKLTMLQAAKVSAKHEASLTAQQVSAQAMEPVLHVARWAMIVALGSFVVGMVALGVAIAAL